MGGDCAVQEVRDLFARPGVDGGNKPGGMETAVPPRRIQPSHRDLRRRRIADNPNEWGVDTGLLGDSRFGCRLSPNDL